LNKQLVAEFLESARDSRKDVAEREKTLRQLDDEIKTSRVNENLYGKVLQSCSDIIEDGLYLKEGNVLAVAAADVISSIGNKGMALDAHYTFNEVLKKIKTSDSTNKEEIIKTVLEGIKTSAHKRMLKI